MEAAPLDENSKYGFTMEADPHLKNASRIQFHYEGDIYVTLRVLTNDYSGSDLVITNLTVVPDTEYGNGFGSKGLQKVLEWAKDQGYKDIRATQVGEHNDEFWTKNGFKFIEGENNTRDFILHLS